MKHLLFPFALVIAITLSVLPACTHDPVITEPVEPVDTMMVMPGNPCSPDTIYFVNDIMPIIGSSCGMGFCHDAESRSGGIEITSFETLMAAGIVEPFEPANSKMIQVMTDMTPGVLMPPSPRGPISDNNIETIRQWIAQGALNNGCREDTVCTPMDPVSFQADVFPVIDKYCIGCHSGNNPWAGLFLRNYDEIRASAEMGDLVGTISHATGYPPMPKDLPKLTDCKIEAITSWVNNGAPDN